MFLHRFITINKIENKNEKRKQKNKKEKRKQKNKKENRKQKNKKENRKQKNKNENRKQNRNIFLMIIRLLEIYYKQWRTHLKPI